MWLHVLDCNAVLTVAGSCRPPTPPPPVAIPSVLRPVGQAGRGCGPLSCWQAGPGNPVRERPGKGQRKGGAWMSGRASSVGRGGGETPGRVGWGEAGREARAAWQEGPQQEDSGAGPGVGCRRGALGCEEGEQGPHLRPSSLPFEINQTQPTIPAPHWGHLATCCPAPLMAAHVLS